MAAALLLNFRNCMIVSFILALIMIAGFGMHNPNHFDGIFWQAVVRWAHVFFGILWIGLLYYFNFVAARKTPEIPAELRPALSKYITPEALFWFRWAALCTVLAGLLLAVMRGYFVKVISLGFAGTEPGEHGQYALLGLGIWMAIIMFLNVWGIFWFGQMMPQTFRNMMIASHMPAPSRAYCACSPGSVPAKPSERAFPM